MRVSKVFLPLALAVALLPAAACRQRVPAAAAEAGKRFPLKGVIREVEDGGKRVTVEHEAVPGYMEGMTMPFPVKDAREVAALLRPGDRIEATLVVEKDKYWLEKILTRGFVTAPAGGSAAGPDAPAKGEIAPRPNLGVAVGDAVPDFALTDQSGQRVRLSDLAGEPVAVAFLYTRCPIATACPMTTAKFSQLDAMLAGKNFGRLVTVTVDPVNDTPRVLADFAAKAGAQPKRWKFLTGSPEAVARVAESFGVLYRTERGQVIHTQAVAVVDPRGRLATIYYTDDWKPEHLLRDMQKARGA